MRLHNSSKPKIHPHTKKGGDFTGWQQCPRCLELVHEKELKSTHRVCPKCDHHFRLSWEERLHLLIDKGSFEELFREIVPTDALHFVDLEPYRERLKKASHGNSKEAVIVGRAKLSGQSVAFGLSDFDFMGGSMGSVMGEKLTLLIEYAIQEKLPVVIVSASGGARMQESIFSLMQMAKVSAALAHLHDARLPYLSILTHPTAGGVTASYATLGDIIIAEPDALVCFTGPRVIEQITRQKLPKGVQRSEFLLERGFVDMIVRRADLKQKIVDLLKFLT